MATLEKIRNKAVLLASVLGLALFAFIIGDFLNSGSTYFRHSQDEVLKVNGHVVKYNEYQERINEMTDMYKMQSGVANFNEEQTAQIRQSVYDALLLELVMRDVEDELGLTVTADELFDMIQGEYVSPMVQQFPLFLDPETQQYSKARALNVLKTIGNIESVPQANRAEIERYRDFWLFWEKSIKERRLQEKYTNLLSKTIVANPLDAEDAYQGSIESSDIVYTMQAYGSVVDSTLQVQENDIKKLYNQRKEDYKQNETRVIDYLVVDILPSKEDYEKVEGDINRIKEDMIHADNIADVVTNHSEIPFIDAYMSAEMFDEDMKEFVEEAAVNEMMGPLFKDDSYRLFKLVDKIQGPDSVKVSIITLMSENRDLTAATALGDSLITLLQKGADFASLAQSFSGDQSAENGGDLGWLTEVNAMRMVDDDFSKKIFSTPLNQPILLKTDYNAFIVTVTAKTANVPKYKLGYVLLSVSPSSKTYGDLYNNLNEFLSKNRTAEQVADAASEAGYNVEVKTKITAADRMLNNLEETRQVIRWAFQDASKNKYSNIFECKNRFVAAVLRDVIPEGFVPLAEVAPYLKEELLQDKKGDYIVNALKEKNLKTIDDYATSMSASIDTVRYINFNTSTISGIGREPKLNADVFYAPLNTLSGPVKGNNGVYVFKVFDRRKEGGDFDAKSEMITLERTMSGRVGYTSVDRLIKQADVTDNRLRFE